MLQQLLQIPMVALIRKEIWEYKSTFVVVPAVLTLTMTAIMVFAALSFEISQDGNTPFIDIGQLAGLSATQREWKIYQLMNDVSIFLKLVLFTVSIFYLCGALYEERKTQTILFWKSLPVSDTQTIFAKWITIALCVPVIYWLAISACQLVSLLLTIYLASGSGFDSVELILKPAHPLQTWFLSLNYIVLDIIWLAPAYGWFLLMSASSKRAPMMSAFIPLIMVSIAESWLWEGHRLFFLIIKRLAPQELMLWIESIPNRFVGSELLSLAGIDSTSLVPHWSDVLQSYARLNLWLGLIFAAGLFVVTVYVRQRRSLE